MWFDAAGHELSIEAWNDDSVRTLQAWVDGGDIRSFEPEGLPVADVSALLIVHSGGPIELTLACPAWAASQFVPIFDSSTVDGAPSSTSTVQAGSVIPLSGPTVMVLRSEGT